MTFVKVFYTAFLCCLFVNGISQDITSNRNPIGLEHNLLYHADRHYIVAQEANGPQLSLVKLFDGKFGPSYTSTAPTDENPTVVTISGLPKIHVQAGAYVGWSTRAWGAKRFKIEGYNSYGSGSTSNSWIVVADYSTTEYSENSFFKRIVGGAFTELRFTFYEGSGNAGRLGVSELIFNHLEATSPYKQVIADAIYDDPGDNILGTKDWDIGTGRTASFLKYGGELENHRILDENPYGEPSIVWEGRPSGGGGDGGFAKDFPIDHEKTYRYVVWMKKTGHRTSGSSYLGAKGASTNNLNDTPNNNPYFFGGDLPELDKWYMLVAYVHGSGYTGMTNLGAMYDGESGQRIRALADRKNKPGATSQRFRTFLNNANVGKPRQQFWGPRVEVVNGSEPSIATLLSVNSCATQNEPLVNDNVVYDFKNIAPGINDNYIRLSNAGQFALIGTHRTGANAGVDVVIKSKDSSDNLVERLRIRENGNVGIGTGPDLADEALTVRGVIHANEVRVDAEAEVVPDYVFEPEYILMSLSDIKAFILTEKHLPEVPSAADMEADGINLKEMNLLLLKKVEELTLHLIDLEEKYEVVKEELGQIRKETNSAKQRD